MTILELNFNTYKDPFKILRRVCIDKLSPLSSLVSGKNEHASHISKWSQGGKKNHVLQLIG